MGTAAMQPKMAEGASLFRPTLAELRQRGLVTLLSILYQKLQKHRVRVANRKEKILADFRASFWKLIDYICDFSIGTLKKIDIVGKVTSH
jgi:hypothetical protein